MTRCGWFYRSLFYDSAGTPSLGRHLAASMLAAFVAREAWCLALATWAVWSGDAASGAAILQAASSPIVAALGAVGAIAPYAVSKIWPQGGVTAEQAEGGDA